MAILAVNAGSSSLKFSLHPLQGGQVQPSVLTGCIEGLEPAGAPEMVWSFAGQRQRQAITGQGDSPFQRALASLRSLLADLEGAPPIRAVAHRVVHGGQAFRESVLVTDAVLERLERLNSLAPLHQPHNLRAIKSLFSLMPEVRQVGCFDTSFHRTRHPVAARFPLPRALFDEGIKRYGFHGLSYEFVARQLPALLGDEKARGGIVVAHLGNGASMCALRDGLSRDTSMGFTAVDGIMMGTRTGSIDPGVMLHLIEQKGMDAKALSNLVYKQSGLLGVSGISQDMRALLESDEVAAKEAIELFCYRAACMIGQLTMAAGGFEALVFTGGIGEHAAPIRARIAEWLEWTGVRLYPAANDRHATRIHAKDSKVEVLVVPTNEEWMIAHHTVNLLGLG